MAVFFVMSTVFAGMVAGVVYWMLGPVREARLRQVSTEEEDYYIDEHGKRKKFPTILTNPTVDLSLIVPAYNEEERFPSMFTETMNYLESRKRLHPKFTYEMIIVDDYSRDKTVELAMSYCKKWTSDRVRVLKLSRNNGKGGAVRKGMLRARGKRMLMVDADGASLITDLEKLEEELTAGERAGEGVAVGSRNHLVKSDAVAKRAWYRNVLMHGFHYYVAITCVAGIKDTQCGFKLFNRKTAQKLFNSSHLDRWSFDVELLFIANKLRIPIVEVPITWTEIPGSKLSIWSATATMFRDLLMIRLLYTFGVWTVAAQV